MKTYCTAETFILLKNENENEKDDVTDLTMKNEALLKASYIRLFIRIIILISHSIRKTVCNSNMIQNGNGFYSIFILNS